MDSPDQYMNIVYKPCGFAERTRPRMIFPHASGGSTASDTRVTASKG